jgi:TonB family protein
MRAELEQIELIEKYLLNTLSADELTAFEATLNSNPKLSSEVNAQKSVIEAIQRHSLKTLAISSYMAWKFHKWLKRILLITLLSSGAFIAFYFLNLKRGPECIPCEQKEQVSESENTEDVAGFPDNCCDEPDTTLLDNVQNTKPEKSFGFEIVLDTGNGLGHEAINNNSSDNSIVEEIGEADLLHLTSNGSDSLSSDEQDDFNSNFTTSTFEPNTTIIREARNKDNKLNGKIDEEPKFPGGEEALQKYLRENMNYPEGAIERRVQGVVYVSFVISKNGTIKNAQVVEGVDRELDEEAVRVVSEMPLWVPGKKRGKSVNLRYTIPVQFSLTGAKVIQYK